jgi:hypothetical protein
MDVFVVTEEVRPPFCDDVYHNIVSIYSSQELAIEEVAALTAAQKRRTGPGGQRIFDWERHVLDEDQV